MFEEFICFDIIASTKQISLYTNSFVQKYMSAFVYKYFFYNVAYVLSRLNIVCCELALLTLMSINVYLSKKNAKNQILFYAAHRLHHSGAQKNMSSSLIS